MFMTRQRLDDDACLLARIFSALFLHSLLARAFVLRRSVGQPYMGGMHTFLTYACLTKLHGTSVRGRLRCDSSGAISSRLAPPPISRRRVLFNTDLPSYESFHVRPLAEAIC